MKAICFTSIISIFICYSGICTHSGFSYEFTDSQISNCHKTHHTKANTNQSVKSPIKSTDTNRQKDSTCCYDSLLNATLNVDHTYFVIVTSDFTQASYINKPIHCLTNSEIRHRDPPYLFIQNSTLLL